ncbi:protein phosphatase 2C domain-containing protein [Alcanivorax hongdengensis A-11-3]|uniref:Protein phosphatase 2C domain-containing protein n=1 Tax=Alcanivorax hongdengensis A-11-3 TaxID=1177179 RepID=L0WAU2_9GAMM|nr:protein phosphatase 2C domain-containing protein [Alcanivorax hongdengensis]EKF74124.1 protein phosphatase 2C domain-containing protein [Alcanivorax hongdengensis A-11-3]
MSGWHGQGRSHAGRRVRNEDSFVCRDQDGLWAVIDGMGGHDAGALAADMIRDALCGVMLGGALGHRVLAVERALQTVNYAIRHHAALHLAGRTMGATVAVLLIQGEEAACLWAGDARLYRLHADHIDMLSRDHSPVQALVDAGELTEQQAMDHPRGHVIWRAVGAAESLEVAQCRFALEPAVRFLLTTDGVHGKLDRAALLAISQRHQPGALLREALARGSRDNVTALLVRRGHEPREGLALR